MQGVALVAVGGAVGSALRYGVGALVLRMGWSSFPVATLAVNIVGCFAMGLVAEVIARRLGASQELRLFLATGVLGGFTTFSAFSLDAVALWERGAGMAAAGYVAASVIGSLAALCVGLWLGRM